MSDEKNEEMLHEAASDFEFLQEKIKERPINKKKLLKRTIITASMAVLFGLLACLSFLLLEPVLNNWLYPEEEPEIVTFPQEKNEMRPEDMLTEGTTTGQEETEAYDETKENTSSKEQETSSAQMTEMVSENSSEIAETAETEPKSSEPPKPEESAAGMETAPAESEPLEPYQMQYEELYKVYREIASSMVTVTAVHADVDWFNNTDQSEGTTAGVIIANNNRELLILSRKSSLDNAQVIRVSFCDGVEADAVIKQYDENTDCHTGEFCYIGDYRNARDCGRKFVWL